MREGREVVPDWCPIRYAKQSTVLHMRVLEHLGGVLSLIYPTLKETG